MHGWASQRTGCACSANGALRSKQLAQPFTLGLLHTHTIGCSAAMVQGATAACPPAQGGRAERQDLEGA